MKKSDYERLLKALRRQKSKKFHQVNYYFDDQDLRLRKKKFALRIRIIDGKTVFFTLKYPSKVAVKGPRSLKVRYEHEVRIPMATAKALLNGEKRIMDLNVGPMRMLHRKFGKSSLTKVRPLGLIETERTVIPLAKWLELEVDRCKVYRKKFYEVEIETDKPRKVDKAIRALLEDLGIPYHPITRSKFARFLAEWKRHGDQ